MASNWHVMRNQLINPTNFSAASIPSLSNKVVIVTGANSGIGKATVLALLQHSPARLYGTARSQAKFDAAFKDVPGVTFLEMDLASLASVNAAASKILGENEKLDVVINNAGIMLPPHATTTDGYETQFGTNHLGHALLIRQLLPLLEKTAALPDSDVRIVNVSSAGHSFAPSAGIIFSDLHSDMIKTNEMTLYGQSKLANVLFTKELARRYPSILSTVVHPGRVESQLLDNPKKGWAARLIGLTDWLNTPMSGENGALTQLWCGFSERKEIKNGGFYAPVSAEYTTADKKCNDEKLAGKLWEWQEEEFVKLGY
jgi:NAD(P)-dependent dehydrogenase (short-subunit alcohol dehydrogenase family)